MTGTILLIDDDISFCETLKYILTAKGFQVEVANDAVAGIRKVYNCKPDAIVLDIMLPDLDGWQICSHLKDIFDIPIIILTALSSEEDVVKGLKLGADDYIVKPVTTDVLLERIQTLLRRVRRAGRTSGNNHFGQIWRHDNLIVDLNRHEVMVNGKRVDLSPTEFQLLTVLIQHEGRMLPHEFLLHKIWGAEYVGRTNYLRLYINYLRRKIEKNTTKPLIHNEWGIGYRFGARL